MNRRVAIVSLYGVENTGVRSLSSVLAREGFEPYVVFFKRWANNDIRMPSEKEKQLLGSVLEEINPGIAGFSFTSPFFKIAAGLTDFLKTRLRSVIVWGGMHATVCPEEC
ncbi:MAG: hypothetical protein ABH885_03235, partial [Candidatus Omnitrophota bacterium]